MNAPDDYQQGATVKIMFLHVPAAWLGMMGWGEIGRSEGVTACHNYTYPLVVLTA